ncbi:hypothetical protein NPIL_609561, partial [Nephila pilipes]
VTNRSLDQRTGVRRSAEDLSSDINLVLRSFYNPNMNDSFNVEFEFRTLETQR